MKRKVSLAERYRKELLEAAGVVSLGLSGCCLTSTRAIARATRAALDPIRRRRHCSSSPASCSLGINELLAVFCE